MARKLSRWYYRLPGNFYALGPSVVRYGSAREFKDALRECFHSEKYGKEANFYPLEKLPTGLEVWRAD